MDRKRKDKVESLNQQTWKTNSIKNADLIAR